MQAIRIILAAGLLFVVAACSESSDSAKPPEAVRVVRLPAKPEGNPSFLNTSSLQSINEVAIGDLRRAGEYTGIDCAMLILDELPELISPEMAAAQLFDEWEVGSETEGKGVLFLFIEKEGVLKVEVGYELEGIFPDAFVGSFQETLKDYYRGEYFGDVVSKMIITMMRRAQGEETQILMNSFVDGLPRLQSEIMEKSTRYRSGGAGVTESNFVTSKAKKLKNVQLLNDKERAQYNKGPKLEMVLQRYLASLQAGVNDPYLSLLTEGSQLMRIEYPKNAGFQRRAAGEFSGNYKVHQSGGFAAVRFERPDVMPILFRMDNQGDWRADITKSWALSQASRDLKQMNTAFGDHAWMFAWANEYHKPEVPLTPDPLAKEKSLNAEIVRLEKAIENEPDMAANYFALADLFYFECYWIRDAMQLIEKGLAIEPGNNRYRKRLIFLSYRFPDLSRVEHHYEQIFQNDRGDYQNLRWYIAYLKNKRSAVYDEKIRILEAAKDHLIIPKFPFPLNAGSGKRQKRTFYLYPGTSRAVVSCQYVVAHPYKKYGPSVGVNIRGNESDKNIGVVLSQHKPGDPVTVIPGYTDLQQISPFKVPVVDAIVIDFRWKKNGILELYVNSRKVLTMRSDMKPTQVRISQSSGGGIFALATE